jgi:hypothetical protein
MLGTCLCAVGGVSSQDLAFVPLSPNFTSDCFSWLGHCPLSPFLLASLPSRVPSFSSHFVLVSLRSRTSLILATRGAAYASPSCSLRCCGSSPSCSHFRVLCCYTAPTRSAWRAWLAADPSAAVASSDGPAFRRSPKHPLLTNAAQGDLCRCAHDLLTPCNRFPPPHSLPLPFHLHFSIVTPAGSAARVHPCNPH